jgi:hypothetical protein
MKSIQDQVSNRCVHFTGIMNKTCKVGVTYESVRFGKPYNFPCLNQGGECSQCKFPTPDEVKKELDEMEVFSLKAITAHTKVWKHFEDTLERSGQIPCDCGGVLNFNVSSYNDHVRAACSKCKLSIQE